MKKLDQLLLNAIKSTNEEEVATYLRKGADPRVIDPSSKHTALSLLFSGTTGKMTSWTYEIEVDVAETQWVTDSGGNADIKEVVTARGQKLRKDGESFVYASNEELIRLASLILSTDESTLHQKNGHGEHPLTVCIFSGTLELLAFLLNYIRSHGQSSLINEADNNGVTPLMKACHADCTEDSSFTSASTCGRGRMLLLLENGADRKIKDRDGNTVLDGLLDFSLRKHSKDSIWLMPVLDFGTPSLKNTESLYQYVVCRIQKQEEELMFHLMRNGTLNFLGRSGYKERLISEAEASYLEAKRSAFLFFGRDKKNKSKNIRNILQYTDEIKTAIEINTPKISERRETLRQGRVHNLASDGHTSKESSTSSDVILHERKQKKVHHSYAHRARRDSRFDNSRPELYRPQYDDHRGYYAHSSQGFYQPTASVYHASARAYQPLPVEQRRYYAHSSQGFYQPTASVYNAPEAYGPLPEHRGYYPIAHKIY